MQENEQSSAEQQTPSSANPQDASLDSMQDQGSEANVPENKLAEFEKALEEAKAQVLYVKAEGENIRRRATEDIDKARKFALEKFATELLAVKDSLDAALAVDTTDVVSYKNGIDLTAKQLLSVFEKFNISEINPENEKFDPNKHQAISAVDSDLEPNTVLGVLQKGYTLNERVLRPALVMVAKAK